MIAGSRFGWLDPGTGRHQEFQLHVLEVRGGAVAHVVAFHAAGTGPFEEFGLPRAL